MMVNVKRSFVPMLSSGVITSTETPLLDSLASSSNQNEINEPELQPSRKLKEKRLDNWERLFPKLLAAGFAINCSEAQICCQCFEPAEILFQCIDCIGYPVMCKNCLQEMHSHPHLHIFEKWNTVGTFIEYLCETPQWKSDRHSQCGSTYLKEILIIDDKGRQHTRVIQFCNCEEEAVSLIYFGLWPSSPVNPKLAFHLELLYWLNGLLLECKVSVQGFCEALKARQPKIWKLLVTKEGREIYRCLIDETIHQFRRYVYQLDYPTDLFADADDGSTCPACYKAEKLYYCMDADFQLVRKSSSGAEWVAPRHRDRFFIAQDLVDNFMINYKNPVLDKDCSDFQAGSIIRSKGKNSKLSETAVFGATCRHDFPYKFFNLRHGERLGYAVFLIEKILSESKEKKIHVSYDIACILVKHLKKLNREDILSNVTFSIPIFHAFGHNIECQLMYSPRRTPHFGLLDGESIERLWSYLGGFASITKEMSPENRVDLLTDGLLFYAQKLRYKQGHTLAKKYERALNLEKTTKLALAEIFSSISVGINEECAIRQWKEEEKAMIERDKDADHSPQTTYLDGIYKLSAERQFLINLLKKYAKGQAVYIRLAKQIKTVNNKMKKGLERINSCRVEGSLTFDEVKNPDNEIFRFNFLSSEVDPVPFFIKQEAVYLSCLLEHCCEEKEFLKLDMQSVIDWYIDQYRKNIDKLCLCSFSEKHFFLKEAMFFEIVIQRLEDTFVKTLGLNLQFNVNFMSLFSEKTNNMDDIFHEVQVEDLSINYDSEDECDFEDCDLT